MIDGTETFKEVRAEYGGYLRWMDWIVWFYYHMIWLIVRHPCSCGKVYIYKKLRRTVGNVDHGRSPCFVLEERRDNANSI